MVWLVAESGKVEQRGAVTANNPDGSGGTVEARAAQLAFGRQAAVHAGQCDISIAALTIDVAAGAV